MIDSAHWCRIVGVVLLISGSTTSSLVMAHSEGVEAADPNTPPAVLTFDAAARRYTALDEAPVDWRSRVSQAAPLPRSDP